MPNDSTHTTIRGVGAFVFLLRRLIFPYVFQIEWIERHRPYSLERCPGRMSGRVELVGHGGWSLA